MNADDERHGTTTGRRLGCKCDPCRQAAAAAMMRRRHRQYLAGTEALSVPNLGTRRRIYALVALGWSMAEISRQAGYDRSHLGLVVRRPGPLQAATDSSPPQNSSAHYRCSRPGHAAASGTTSSRATSPANGRSGQHD